jgi:uncharacterized protein
VRRVWDPDKDEINRKKHGVSFEEASELFDGRDYFEVFDVEHSIDEDRFIGCQAGSSSFATRSRQRT